MRDAKAIERQLYYKTRIRTYHRGRHRSEVLEFFAAGATATEEAAVFVEINYSSERRWQICRGGGFRGPLVRATASTFKSVCEKWTRQRRRRRWLSYPVSSEDICV